MYIIGDKLKIKYQVLVDQKEEIELEGTVVITYFDGKKLYTCGHCFPKNATLIYGDLIYSSGFDTPTEEQEIAIIEIKPNYLSLFKKIKLNFFKKYKI